MIIDEISHITRAFFDDENAIKLLDDIYVVFQSWDDSHDKDNPDAVNEYERSFELAMIELPKNPLYIHCGVPFLIEQAWIKWCAANELEKNNEHLEKAYMLRADYFNIFIAIYSAINGHKKAAEQAANIWKCYGEQLDNFINEVRLCRAQY